MAFIPRLYINPYGKRPYKAETSKSIFKDQTLFSNLINSINVNQLSNIFNNDLIIKGMDLKSASLSNNNRSMNFVLSNGMIMQDLTIIKILEDINISIDIFSQYNIEEANTSENYFKINGNQIKNFPEGKTFGIFDSIEFANNHLYWVVKETKYDGSFTKIYTHQSVDYSDTSGQIVNNNFPDDEFGEIILMSKYMFVETLDDNPVEFIPMYRNSKKIYEEFDSNLHRIIYEMFEIEKDHINYKIVNYNRLEKFESVLLNNFHYVIHNINDTYTSTFDGGVLN